MIKLSLKLFKSAFKINVFVMIQFIVVFLTCIFMVSSVYSRLEFYLPLKDIMNKKASAVTFHSEYIDKKNNKTFLLDHNTSPLKDELINVDKIYERYSPYVNNDDRTLTVYSYDDNVVSMYTPSLKSGKWLSETNAEDDVIPTVIYQNKLNYKIGDTFSAAAKTYDNEDIDIIFKVIGILDESAKIFGGSNQPLNNYLSFFSSPVELFGGELENNEPVLMAIVRNEIVNDYNIVAYYDTVNAIVTYDENTTDKETVLNTSELNLRYGSITDNIGTIKEKSFIYIKTQLYTLLPIILCISIIALISSICISAVITKKNMKKYIVFFICGMEWKKCIQICLFNSIITSLLSFAAAVLISMLAAVYTDMSIHISIYGILICGFVMAVYILLSLIIPYRILKSSTPKDLLIRN